MTPPDPYDIRRIFLTPRPNLPLMTAAERLGMTLQELKRDIADGAIVAVSTRVGTRVTKEEMIATAMRLWDQSVIEEALGDDAPRLIPEAIRLVELGRTCRGTSVMCFGNSLVAMGRPSTQC